MNSPFLHLESVSKSFGGIQAVNNVSLNLERGEIVGLIGPNGAGKTTLVNLLTGTHRANAGRIVFQGEDVTRQKPHQAARRGLARTFQIVQPFPEMSVLDNVAAGALFGGGPDRLEDAREASYEHLEFVGIERFAALPASTLSLAHRKRLELAKSLAMRPTLLMLDEVNAGLNSSEINDALALIQRISERGITILIIEHLMRVILSVSQRILVLHHGALIAGGAPEEVIKDQRVIEAYLGEKYAHRLKGSNVG
jgi:branched-chain amino acid transport system ATP-binding protein